MKYLFICVFLLFAVGCFNNTTKRDTLIAQYQKFEQENVIRASTYTHTANELLARVPDEHRTQEVELAHNFSSMSEALLPKPDFTLGLNVDQLLSDDKKLAKQALAIVEQRFTEDGLRVHKMEEIEKRLGQVEKILIDKGGKYEEEQRKNMIAAIWKWGIATFGIGGFIALIIFVPAALPLIMNILSMIVNQFVVLIQWLVPAFGRVVKGIGNVRDQLKKEAELNKADNPTKIAITYTPDEVLELIDNELKIATDEKDKKVIEKIRQKVKI